jgi:hypothetical protein
MECAMCVRVCVLRGLCVHHVGTLMWSVRVECAVCVRCVCEATVLR